MDCAAEALAQVIAPAWTPTEYQSARMKHRLLVLCLMFVTCRAAEVYFLSAETLVEVGRHSQISGCWGIAEDLHPVQMDIESGPSQASPVQNGVWSYQQEGFD
jgi:hypothetical protein